MRFFWTVVLAALLLFVLYVVAGAIVDGYLGGNMIPDRFVPDSWAAPDSWSEWRDIMIVLVGVLAVLSVLLTIVLLVVLIVLALTARSVLKNHAAPALDSLKETLDNVKGTVEFAGETAVSPIIRVYSIVSGIRSGVAAVTKLPRFISRRRGKR